MVLLHTPDAAWGLLWACGSCVLVRPSSLIPFEGLAEPFGPLWKIRDDLGNHLNPCQAITIHLESKWGATANYFRKGDVEETFRNDAYTLLSKGCYFNDFVV